MAYSSLISLFAIKFTLAFYKGACYADHSAVNKGAE